MMPAHSRKEEKVSLYHAYVKKGPDTIGDRFGYYGMVVPEDKWVIVTYDKYTNGCWGLVSINDILYPSAEAAQQALEKLIQEERLKE